MVILQPATNHKQRGWLRMSEIDRLKQQLILALKNQFVFIAQSNNIGLYIDQLRQKIREEESCCYMQS